LVDAIRMKQGFYYRFSWK